jgi:LysM repeat protein
MAELRADRSNVKKSIKYSSIKFVARTALVSLCSAAALGFVGAPGAMASTSARIPMVSTASGMLYTVQKNDSLIGIANRTKVSLGDLLSANGFTRTTVITPGQVIKLPDHAVASGITSTGTTSGPVAYTVRKGDSLTAIAARVKISLTALLKANNFTKSSVIHPGQTITLPSGAIVPASAQAATATSSTTIDAPSSPSNPGEGSAPTELQTYKVQSGDSLIAISTKAKVSLDALLKVNNFTKSSVIHPGQIIKLPIGAAAPSTRVQTMIAFAKAQVGKPYLFGAAGPGSYDCSGLVRASFAKVGVSVPHQSRALAVLGTAVDWRNSPIQAGDLIFTFSGGDTSQIGHVAIAISATEMVEALSPGKNVSIRTIPSKDRIQAVRRLL